MRYFCTYFDSNYLVRLLPMLRSLRCHGCTDFTLFALCLDEIAERVMYSLNDPNVVVVPLRELEEYDREAFRTKALRSQIEYYFTLSPCIIRYLLARHPHVDLLTYLDADVFFYSSVEPVFAEMGENAVLIVPHRFPARIRHMEKNGIYNVALVSFRRNEAGMRCLSWWRERCIEWCFDRNEDGKYGDQKYLDDWPTRFPLVCVSQHKGADLAPWNVEQYAITRRNGVVCVDDDPLIFYHFQGYRQLSDCVIDPGLDCFGKPCRPEVVKLIHLPYVRAVLSAKRDLRKRFPEVDIGGGAARNVSDSFADFSFLYKTRFLLEGKAILWFAGRAWYFVSPVIPRLLRIYDTARNRLRVG